MNSIKITKAVGGYILTKDEMESMITARGVEVVQTMEEAISVVVEHIEDKKVAVHREGTGKNDRKIVLEYPA